MKKLLLMIALTTGSFVNAQITTNAGTFNKPTAGDVAFEMQFTPNLQGTAMFAESTSGTLMMRTFKSDTKATRLAASFSLSNDGSDGASTPVSIALGYGIENHFSGAERLSTYWGYQGTLGYADDGADDIITIGGGVFLGTEYYIVPKVYIGTEIGYGLGIVSANDTAFGLASSITGNLRLGFRL